MPNNKAFAENVVAEGGAADGNPKLYRVSTGHGGLFCEACHGTNLTGTVLSRTADDRTVRCKTTQGSLPECKAGQTTAVIPKGTPVGCGMCHRQK